MCRRPVAHLFVLTLVAVVGCVDGPPAQEGEGEGDPGEGEGEGDPGEGEGEGEGEGDEPCAFSTPGAADRARVVVVSHATNGGTTIRTLTLTGTTLDDDGVRLDVGTDVRRMEFVPDGSVLLALGEDGLLVSVAVTAVDQLTVIGSVRLPAAGYGDLRLAADGRTAWVVGSNVTEDTSGVYVVTVKCDGTVTHDAGAAHGLRLSTSLAPLGDGRAVLLGGQAAFDPIDNDDTRLLQLGPPVTEVAAFDLWGDAVGATRIAASPDGALVAVPNNSMFSALAGTVKLFSVAGDVVAELDDATGMETPSEALFSPSGELLLVSDWEADAVHLFDVRADTLAPVGQVSGVGLAEALAVVARGAHAGLVLAAATNAVGNVQLLQISGTAVDDLGQVDLGDGVEDIPWAIAVQP